MNELTYGDLILLELSLVQYMASVDVTTQCGQYLSSLLGKIEYKLSLLGEAARRPVPVAPALPNQKTSN